MRRHPEEALEIAKKLKGSIIAQWNALVSSLNARINMIEQWEREVAEATEKVRKEEKKEKKKKPQ